MTNLLLTYERDYAAWEATRPKTRLVDHFQAIGRDLATAGVRDGLELSLPAKAFDAFGAEVEWWSRLPRSGTPRPHPTDPSIVVETACGAITIERR